MKTVFSIIVFFMSNTRKKVSLAFTELYMIDISSTKRSTFIFTNKFCLQDFMPLVMKFLLCNYRDYNN